jgi:hypothetical protein
MCHKLGSSLPLTCRFKCVLHFLQHELSHGHFFVVECVPVTSTKAAIRRAVSTARASIVYSWFYCRRSCTMCVNRLPHKDLCTGLYILLELHGYQCRELRTYSLSPLEAPIVALEAVDYPVRNYNPP